eukprot:NODE_1899_length_477_cov_716.039720_g1821_i0.p1 GENE.NODE_1899_length_477_cov_716.039720_g1821_i0~~NODE_1899_length_477_cov_716.039720_g1821_i0.p1  ORF type:complete len:104 (+),score=33.40 NODE_1899_length_477_cov_716.039720_g1821_i0:60-371(+)
MSLKGCGVTDKMNHAEVGAAVKGKECLLGTGEPSGYTIYGANWCPHCHTAAHFFAGGHKTVKFVDCAEGHTCPKSITGYPTIMDASGKEAKREDALSAVGVKI